MAMGVSEGLLATLLNCWHTAVRARIRFAAPQRLTLAKRVTLEQFHLYPFAYTWNGLIARSGLPEKTEPWFIALSGLKYRKTQSYN